MPRTYHDIYQHYGVGPIAREAKHVADVFYAAVGHQDYEAALVLFDDSFFTKWGREGWAATLAENALRLGALKRREIATRSEVQKRDGIHYGLEYRVDYENHSTREKFVLSKKKGEEDIRIVEYSLKCKELSFDWPP